VFVLCVCVCVCVCVCACVCVCVCVCCVRYTADSGVVDIVLLDLYISTAPRYKWPELELAWG
jgi:hypothetical protein